MAPRQRADGDESSFERHHGVPSIAHRSSPSRPSVSAVPEPPPRESPSSLGFVARRATGSATGGNLALDAPDLGGVWRKSLVDLRGQVVGIATTDVHVMDERSRGGFAIPIDRAKVMLRQALASATAQMPPTTAPVG
jgi:hypothetical protein